MGREGYFRGVFLGTIVRLAAVRSHNIIEVLEHYLALARDGELTGVAVGAKHSCGFEDSTVAGDYLAKPELGALAAMRLGRKMMQLQDAQQATACNRPRASCATCPKRETCPTRGQVR